MSPEFETNLQSYLEHIKANYVGFGKIGLDESDPIKVKIREEMIERFNAALSTEKGSKYIKVVSNGGVHSFIVIKADGKFQVGDILKAASWAAPARNFKRGNILSRDFGNATWTGVH